LVHLHRRRRADVGRQIALDDGLPIVVQLLQQPQLREFAAAALQLRVFRVGGLVQLQFLARRRQRPCLQGRDRALQRGLRREQRLRLLVEPSLHGGQLARDRRVEDWFGLPRRVEPDAVGQQVELLAPLLQQPGGRVEPFDLCVRDHLERRRRSGHEQQRGQQRRRDRVPSRPTPEAAAGADASGHDGFVTQDAQQVGCEVGGGGVASARVLLHRLLQHRDDVRGQPRVETARIRHRVAQDAPADFDLRGTGERPLQREALERGHRQRVDVRPAIDQVAPADPLGRHVGRSADHVGRTGQRRVAVAVEARQAEVEQHGFAGPVDHDVRRLHVPVHDAGLVGGVQGQGDLRQQRERVADLGRCPRRSGRVGTAASPRQARREGLAVDVLHGQERRAVDGS
jgi:hypothetical protein